MMAFALTTGRVERSSTVNMRRMFSSHAAGLKQKKKKARTPTLKINNVRFCLTNRDIFNQKTKRSPKEAIRANLVVIQGGNRSCCFTLSSCTERGPDKQPRWAAGGNNVPESCRLSPAEEGTHTTGSPLSEEQDGEIRLIIYKTLREERRKCRDLFPYRPITPFHRSSWSVRPPYLQQMHQPNPDLPPWRFHSLSICKMEWNRKFICR